VGWEKVTHWITKAALYLKCVKIEEKLLWRAYRSPKTFKALTYKAHHAVIFAIAQLPELVNFVRYASLAKSSDRLRKSKLPYSFLKRNL